MTERRPLRRPTRRGEGSTPRRRREESGQAVLEFLGILPMAILLAGAIIQLFLVAYAAVEAESAARLAARDLSQGGSASSAESHGEDQVSGFFDAEVEAGYGTASGGEPGITVSAADDAVSAVSTVTIPFLGFGVQGLDLEMTRTATMPADPSDSPF